MEIPPSLSVMMITVMIIVLITAIFEIIIVIK